MTVTHRFRISPALKLSLFVASGLAGIISFTPSDANAQTPSLIVTSEPVPESLKTNLYKGIAQPQEPVAPSMRSDVYSKPVQLREITPNEIVGTSYYNSGITSGTAVSAKIDSLESELGGIESKISSLSSRLSSLQRANEDRSASYYANIATINTQLQSGTTPGNPRLVNKLSVAENNLEELGSSVSSLNGLSVEIANTASEASYLLESTRAAYRISGAIEEDHVRLSEMEDSINDTLITIDRVLNTANDEITRTTSYLASERNNLRTLALGVTNGDLYGASLANRPFSSAGQFQLASTSGAPVAAVSSDSAEPMYEPAAPAPALGSPRLLAKVKFDRPDVDYEQPIFVAVNEALARYPNARFDLVAVNPTSGNAAEVAIETTRARRNAEKVLRTLTQMGLSPAAIDVSHNSSSAASSNEVHLYVK